MIPLKKVIDFIFHIDKYINILIQNYGTFTYFILFLIIFLETGLVITPFLPGDSLLFVLGAFSAQQILNFYILLIVISLAAILGDTFNYWIGNYFGEKIFSKNRLFKEEYLKKTKEFYKKHGKKTIVLARFIPIIRTFAPFVAGVGKMKYTEFLLFNIVGGISWVLIFLGAGYFFGTIPIIKENLTLTIVIIIIISMMPYLNKVISTLRKKKKV